MTSERAKKEFGCLQLRYREGMAQGEMELVDRCNRRIQEMLEAMFPDKDQQAVRDWMHEHCLEGGGPGQTYRDSFSPREIEDALFAGIAIGRKHASEGK